MALMCLLPLSDKWVAWFPNVFESLCKPPIPNPILESQLEQSFPLFATMPILASECLYPPRTLNRCLLQFLCSEACERIRDFHLLRTSDKARYLPSAISAYNEMALRSITTNLVVEPVLIPRQIFEKSVSPNMRAIWFLDCQNPSSLLQGCKHSCRSRNERNSGRFSAKDT